MIQLMLKHEDQLQSLARTGETGIQPLMVKATTTWTEEMQSSKPPSLPLRMVLVSSRRCQKISQMDHNSAPWQQTVATQVILTDGTWPYLQRNHGQNKLEINQKVRACL